MAIKTSWQGATLGANTFTGAQTFSPTNTLDVGTSATVLAPRTVYAGTSFVGPIGTFTTSVAIGGATIGSNALAVTGTSLFTGVLTFVGDPLITTAASALITLGSQAAASGQGVVKYNAATDQFEITATRSNGTTGDVVLRVANSTVVFSALRNGSVALGTAADVIMSRSAAANLQLGAAAVDTAPVAQTLSVQNVLAGGTSDVAGANFTIKGSQGKGTGVGGNIILQTAPAGSTGTAVNALATVATLYGSGDVGIGSGSAIATSATAGFLLIPTCAGTPTGAPPNAGTGKAAIIFDTTNSQLWVSVSGATWKQPKTPAGAAIVTWQ